MEFKPYACYMTNKSPYPEGDKNEDLEANIHVYENGKYNNSFIRAKIANGKSYFTVWKNDGTKFRFDCLRNSAFEVIKQCSEHLKRLKKGMNITQAENLNGIAHNILESLLSK